MKNNKEIIKKEFDKFVAVTLAKLLPIERKIVAELRELYVDLDEESAYDWTYEIINCIDQSEIDHVFERLDSMNSLSC